MNVHVHTFNSMRLQYTSLPAYVRNTLHVFRGVQVRHIPGIENVVYVFHHALVDYLIEWNGPTYNQSSIKLEKQELLLSPARRSKGM